MSEKVRKHFNATSLVAVIALVFAMTGGAYAASKILITSTKQISPKVLKSLKGATGKAGANGTAGPAGPAGPSGAGGPPGATGPQGAPGGTGEKGPQGTPGVEGKAGKNGTTGFTEVLPSKKTETGTWAFGPDKASTIQVAIASFAIPLKEGIEGSHVHLIKEGKELHFESAATTPTECGEPVGTVLAPAAAPGNLCVYVDSFVQAESFTEAINNPEGAPGAGPTGALMTILGSPELESFGHGSWAVTAP